VVGKVKMEVAPAATATTRARSSRSCSVSKAFGDKVIAKDFSATLLRGDKIGLPAPTALARPRC
jgi:ATP-binding cassette subfamily F protein uup